MLGIGRTNVLRCDVECWHEGIPPLGVSQRQRKTFVRWVHYADPSQMSIHDVEVSKGHPDPRLDMTEKSLDGTYGTCVASRPSANGTSVSEK
jgi:hypothetical protein